MRWINVIVVAVLAAAILIFAVQNFQSTTVSFLSFRISAPLALLVAVVYHARHGDRRLVMGADALGLGRIEANLAPMRTALL